jgi:hypothetical protein
LLLFGALLLVLLIVSSQIEWASDDASIPPAPAPAPAPAPVQPLAPQAPTLTLLLGFKGDSWFELQVDGVVVEPGVVVRDGTELVITAESEVRLRLGNAGAVFMTLNGDDLGAAGALGQVVGLTFSVGGSGGPAG